ncbi:hypothetical protein V7793_10635 [Streptomyces sp. KLMMK]|uniref:hypothetical protein n=1 Tax=Streptomyces sp. KLMMK TaxID=3109353 RepID=UPI00300A665A
MRRTGTQSPADSSASPVDRDELLRRLAGRNQCRDANTLTVNASALDDFFARFEPTTRTA